MRKQLYGTILLLVVLVLVLLPVDWKHGEASSHREAPLIMLDPTADLTDVYAFVSPEAPETVTLVMDVIPFEEPAGGPNFYRFDDNVLYALRIDNDGDAEEDIVYEFRFETEILNPNTFLYNTGPITSVTDPNYNFRQTYTITRVDLRDGQEIGEEVAGGLPVPPEHIGPASTPDYESLDGVQSLVGGRVKAFAGQRDDPFFFDLGAIFDLLTIRPGPPGNQGGGVDGFGGFNVHTIALQVPVEFLTADGEELDGPQDKDAVIGVWATTSRPRTTVLRSDGTRRARGQFVQVARLGQPAINEVVIPLGKKDLFNASEPVNDEQFLEFVLEPELAALLRQLYGLNVPPPPRNDLLVLLTGIPGLNQPMNAGPGGVEPAELLRLNMGIPPKKPGNEGFSRLGVLGGDLSGFPNGRRLQDDVVDVALRIIAGVLIEDFNMPPNNMLGDGVPVNDREFTEEFPYLATPWQGFEHEHHPVGPNLSSEEGVSSGSVGPASLPRSSSLRGNYPNPFGEKTTIEFDLAETERVTLEVYDVLGRKVATLVDKEMGPGTHAVNWDARGVSSGMYIYRLKAGDLTRSQEMTVVR